MAFKMRIKRELYMKVNKSIRLPLTLEFRVIVAFEIIYVLLLYRCAGNPKPTGQLIFLI